MLNVLLHMKQYSLTYAHTFQIVVTDLYQMFPHSISVHR